MAAAAARRLTNTPAFETSAAIGGAPLAPRSPFARLTAKLVSGSSLLALIAGLSWPEHARAWTRYFPNGEAWRGELVYAVRPPSTPHVAAGWREELTRAFRVWSETACPLPSLRYVGTTQVAPNVELEGADGVSVIGFEERTWRYGEGITALTRARARAGAIVEADLLLNAVDFEWRVDATGSPSARLRELRFTLPHELGHFLGLGHSDAHAALMHRDALRSKLAPDDLAGLCALYPARKAARRCTAWSAWALAASVLALGLAALAFSARRRPPR